MADLNLEALQQYFTDATYSKISSPDDASDISAKSRQVKVVLVGDGSIGKTSLVVSYTTNGYPTEYIPTAYDNYSVKVTVDNQPISFQICDTAGQSDFDSIRPLCYPGADVFLVCFSVVNPTSFHNVSQKWLAELNKHAPNVPRLLIGTQCDLRNDVRVLLELDRYKEQPVSLTDAHRMRRIMDAVTYVECSALTQRNMKEVFDGALLLGLDAQAGRLMARTNSNNSGKSVWKKLCCLSIPSS